MRNRTAKPNPQPITTELPRGTLLDRLFEEWLPRFWAFLAWVWDHRPEHIDAEFGKPTRIDLFFEAGLKWAILGMPPERLLDEAPRLTTQPASPPPPPDEWDLEVHWPEQRPPPAAEPLPPEKPVTTDPPPRPGPSPEFLRAVDEGFQAERDPKTPPPLPPEAGQPLKPAITETQFFVALGGDPDRTPPPFPRVELNPQEIQLIDNEMSIAVRLTPPPRWWTELTWSQVVLTLHIGLWVWATIMLFGVIGRQVALPVVTPLLMVAGGIFCHWGALATLPTGPLPIVAGGFFTALMAMLHLRYQVDFEVWNWGYPFCAYLLTGLAVAIYRYRKEAWRWDQVWNPYHPPFEWIKHQLIPLTIRIDAFLEEHERQVKWGLRAGLLLLSSAVSTVVFLRCGLEIAWWGYPFLALGVFLFAGVNAFTGGKPLWVALVLTIVPAMFTTGMNLWCNFAIIFVAHSLFLAWPLWKDYRFAKEMNQPPHWW